MNMVGQKNPAMNEQIIYFCTISQPMCVRSDIFIRSKKRLAVVAPLNDVDGNVAWTESFSPGHWCNFQR